VAERRRRRARSLRLIDAWSGYEIIFFYVPRWRRMVCYLRDPVTFYFIARLYAISVCADARFRYCARKYPSSNLIVESRCCVAVEHSAWENMERVEDVAALLSRVADEAEACAVRCHTELYGVVPDTVGISYYVLLHPRMSERARERVRALGSGREPEEYCAHRRCYPDGRPVGFYDKTKDWERIRREYADVVR